jgi:hypothetical protein
MEEEQKIVISQTVSKARSVDVCQLSLTPQPERRMREATRRIQSFLANGGIDIRGTFYF